MFRVGVGVEVPVVADVGAALAEPVVEDGTAEADVAVGLAETDVSLAEADGTLTGRAHDASSSSPKAAVASAGMAVEVAPRRPRSV